MDRFRIAPRQLTDDEEGHIAQMKELAEQLQLLFTAGSRGIREADIATQHLEAAVMWAIKGIGT